LDRRPIGDDDLPTRVVRRESWPTPTKSDGEGGPGNSGREGGENLRTAAGGSLNPTWVEWLMGFPLGWTDLDRSLGNALVPQIAEWIGHRILEHEEGRLADAA
jgi:site-specific DNA-cytosine methylase